MATTVVGAFDQFLRYVVRLDPNTTAAARGSRDWLISRFASFHLADATFPLPYAEKNIAFGSFARGTKIRELDDIDLVFGLHGGGATYRDLGRSVEIIVHDVNCRLAQLCHQGNAQLNSRRVVNKFVTALKAVPQYEAAEPSRNGEAAVVNLRSRVWSFDVVPGFFTSVDAYGRDYYLIPDGAGQWKKTDPRIDRDICNRINRRHTGNALDVIRAVKYWNRRAMMPTVPSYILETILLRYFAIEMQSLATAYVDIEIPGVLAYLADAIQAPVVDHKQLQGDLNTLSWDQRFKIRERALADLLVANNARALELQGDHQRSIDEWRRFFGAQFPVYG